MIPIQISVARKVLDVKRSEPRLQQHLDVPPDSQATEGPQEPGAERQSQSSSRLKQKSKTSLLKYILYS